MIPRWMEDNGDSRDGGEWTKEERDAIDPFDWLKRRARRSCSIAKWISFAAPARYTKRRFKSSGLNNQSEGS